MYYTAVEGFHGGKPTTVTGCSQLECTRGKDNLGTFPASFVTAVKAEGTGRTTRGRYLNWSHDTGFWLDDAPRDAAGRPLRPFESAAADPSVLPRNTQLTIVTCGHDEGGDQIPTTTCDRLRRAAWIVTDEFTPGLGGDKHVDVYIGEETTTNFTEGPWYVTLLDATLRRR